MPFGTIAACAFFLLLFVAALGSAIAILELMVSLLVRRSGIRRRLAAFLAGLCCFLAGVATVLSFNVWSGWYPLEGIPGFDKATVYDLLDYLTSNILLPVDGFFIALFAGWAVQAAPRRGIAADASGSRRVAVFASVCRTGGNSGGCAVFPDSRVTLHAPRAIRRDVPPVSFVALATSLVYR